MKTIKSREEIKKEIRKKSFVNEFGESVIYTAEAIEAISNSRTPITEYQIRSALNKLKNHDKTYSFKTLCKVVKILNK